MEAPIVVPAKERRLLLVDDDPGLLRALRRLFENQGWRVFPADGVHDAMRVISRFRPEVALVDVCMPDGGALGFFAQSDAQNLHLPTVLMSGSPQVRKVVEERLKGTVRFVDKPLDVELVEQELRAALESHQPPATKAERARGALEKRVEELVAYAARNSTELPVLDPTLAASLPLFQMESTRTEAVVRILGRDAATTASVIRLANSGFFKGSRSIETLEDACVRIGLQGISEIVHEIAVLKAFEIRSVAFSILGKHIWENASATARLARAIAKGLNPPDVSPGEVYIMALLHNVGEAAALYVLDKHLEVDERRLVTVEMLDPHIRLHHEATGASVFTKWGLPASLVAMAGSHHNDNASAPLHRRIVRTAYEIASRSRFPYPFGPKLPPLDLRPMDPEMSEDEIASIQATGAELDRYAQFLGVPAIQLRSMIDATFAL